MYPIAIPMECALTGIRQAGHPGRAPTGRGAGSTWGSGALLVGVGGGGPNLGQLSRSSPSPTPPPSAPQRRRQPSSWVRTSSRYMPGPAAGGKAGPCRLSTEGRAGMPVGGLG